MRMSTTVQMGRLGRRGPWLVQGHITDDTEESHQVLKAAVYTEMAPWLCPAMLVSLVWARGQQDLTSFLWR